MNFTHLFSPLKVGPYQLYGGDVAGFTDYPVYDGMEPAQV
jgi:hypothetical protein